uniref:C2H2-type domain-containing protein n=1 Tax=Rhodnius prolixus TaxID=13249 RepID=T1I1E3_RHOPR
MGAEVLPELVLRPSSNWMLRVLAVRFYNGLIGFDTLFTKKNWYTFNDTLPLTGLPEVYTCTKCPRTYKHATSLYRHIKCECGKQPIYQCPHCPYRAKRKDALKKHAKNIHLSLLLLSSSEMLPQRRQFLQADPFSIPLWRLAMEAL